MSPIGLSIVERSGHHGAADQHIYVERATRGVPMEGDVFRVFKPAPNGADFDPYFGKPIYSAKY